MIQTKHINNIPKAPLIWTNIFFFLTTGLITLIGVPLYGMFTGFSLFQIISALILMAFCGFSITMGYHRLWSHRAFDANPALRLLLALGGALAIQNSILHWSSDHREHHRKVDHPDQDPYSASRGFWYSHIGWMLSEYQQQRYHDYSNVKDLQKDRIVRWQHRHYWALAWAANLVITIALGLIDGDLLGMILLAGVARITLSQHVTFLINSLAHLWGCRPYSDENSARDNGLVALLTYGEGYHNFHHRFAGDYRNGIRWWQFDPTKWLIKACSWLGLSRNLRRYSDERIERARAQLQLKHARERLSLLPRRDALLTMIQQEYELLLQRMGEFYEAKKRLLSHHSNPPSMDELKQLKRRIQELKNGWKNQSRQWRRLLTVHPGSLQQS